MTGPAASGWKGISTKLLEEAGVTSSDDGLIRVPYRTLTGEIHNVRVFAPSGRCWWERSGLELMPFGLEALRAPPGDRGLIIAEGESDAFALRRHFGGPFGYDVLGVPGARTWRPDWARLCNGYTVGYVLGDGDDAGRDLAAAVQRDLPQVRPVPMPDGEDARSLIQRKGPGAIDRLLEEADRLSHEQERHFSNLLGQLLKFVRDYVVVSPAQAVAITLWIAHTHALEACETTPFLAITSPEKRCGKSRLFDVLELVVARPWKTVTPSEAVLYRKIDAVLPTLLLDETDAIFTRNANTEPLRALLNAGNRRGTSVPRCVGPTMAIVDFKVFCAKALAGIGDLPDTISDRAIVIRMARKRRDESAQRFRLREALKTSEPIHRGLASWAEDVVADLELARPEVPDILDDRAEEAWEPLLAIADLAGGTWPERARQAAIELSADREDDEALGVLLLRDIQKLFATKDVDRFSSADLAAALNEIETSPWGDIRGKALDGRELARRLKPFGVRPRTVRFEENPRANGYLLRQFEDAFARYLTVSIHDNVTTASISGKEADSDRDTDDRRAGFEPFSVHACHAVMAENVLESLSDSRALVQDGLEAPANPRGGTHD